MNCATLMDLGQVCLKGGARWAYKQGLAMGLIKRPQHCEFCGTDHFKRSLYGHHEDYAHALDVFFICGSCHRKLHNDESRKRFIEGARMILRHLPSG